MSKKRATWDGWTARSRLSPARQADLQARAVFLRAAGATHLVAANAGNTEPAELVLVADEGAQLTTFIE
jgi:hypothetical protein